MLLLHPHQAISHRRPLHQETSMRPFTRLMNVHRFQIFSLVAGVQQHKTYHSQIERKLT